MTNPNPNDYNPNETLMTINPNDYNPNPNPND